MHVEQYRFWEENQTHAEVSFIAASPEWRLEVVDFRLHLQRVLKTSYRMLLVWILKHRLQPWSCAAARTTITIPGVSLELFIVFWLLTDISGFSPHTPPHTPPPSANLSVDGTPRPLDPRSICLSAPLIYVVPRDDSANSRRGAHRLLEVMSVEERHGREETREERGMLAKQCFYGG